MKNNNNSRNSSYVSVTKDGESLAGFYAGDEWKEVVDEFVDESPFPNRSEAIRALVIMGIRSSILDDPRRRENQEETSSPDEFTPVTIRELVPEGEENALSLRDEFTDIIDEKIIEIVENDPEIKRKGWEVYR